MTEYTPKLPAISADELVGLLKEVVSGNEDYVYPRPGQTCLYVDDSDPQELKPSCGIGHLFYKIGVSLEELRDDWENRNSSKVANSLLTLVDGDEYTVHDALQILNFFQECQDNQMAWGPSLVEAIRDCENDRNWSGGLVKSLKSIDT